MTAIIPDEMMSPISATEAKNLDARIMTAGDEMGHCLLQINEGKGWEHLGFKSFKDYCASVGDRLGQKSTIYNLIDKAKVERNISEELGKPVRLGLTHAQALSELPPEGQVEVYKEFASTKSMLPPTAKQFAAKATAWLKAHGLLKKSKTTKVAYGWSEDDLDKDNALSDALDGIEKVYGKGQRRAIQEGAIELSRKEVIQLAKLPDPKMREVQYLIIENRWSLQRSLDFVSRSCDEKSTAQELAWLAMTNKSQRLDATINGFQYTVVHTRRK